MKKILILFFIFLVGHNVFSQDCDKFPEERLNACCGTEQFSQARTIKKIFDSYNDENMTHFMKECKINEDLFSKLGLIEDDEIHMESVGKFLDEAFQDNDRKTNYKAAAEICNKEVMSNLEAIQKKYEAEPFNLKKSKCNVKFMAVHSCVNLETFINCPEKLKVSSATCDYGRKWLHKCVRTQDIHSIMEIISMKRE